MLYGFKDVMLAILLPSPGFKKIILESIICYLSTELQICLIVLCVKLLKELSLNLSLLKYLKDCD